MLKVDLYLYLVEIDTNNKNKIRNPATLTSSFTRFINTTYRHIH